MKESRAKLAALKNMEKALSSGERQTPEPRTLTQPQLTNTTSAAATAKPPSSAALSTQAPTQPSQSTQPSFQAHPTTCSPVQSSQIIQAPVSKCQITKTASMPVITVSSATAPISKSVSENMTAPKPNKFTASKTKTSDLTKNAGESNAMEQLPHTESLSVNDLRITPVSNSVEEKPVATINPPKTIHVESTKDKQSTIGLADAAQTYDPVGLSGMSDAGMYKPTPIAESVTTSSTYEPSCLDSVNASVAYKPTPIIKKESDIESEKTTPTVKREIKQEKRAASKDGEEETQRMKALERAFSIKVSC